MKRLGLIACGLWWLAGCTTPVIPLPPPDPSAMTFTIDEQVMPPEATFAYDPYPAYADALVYVLNTSRGTGVITTANPDGSVSPTRPFEGGAGDLIVTTFMTTDGDEVANCVVLRAGRLNANDRCP